MVGVISPKILSNFDSLVKTEMAATRGEKGNKRKGEKILANEARTKVIVFHVQLILLPPPLQPPCVVTPHPVATVPHFLRRFVLILQNGH